MKTLSPALQAHLDEGTTTLAWCWKITPVRGPLPAIAFTNSFMWPDGDPYDWHSATQASWRQRLPPRYGTWQIAPFNPGASNVAAFKTSPWYGDKTGGHHSGDWSCYFDIDVSEIPAGSQITYSDIVERGGTYDSVGANSIVTFRWFTLAQTLTFDGTGKFLAQSGTSLSPSINNILNGPFAAVPRSLTVTVPAGARMIRLHTETEGIFNTFGFVGWNVIYNPVLSISACSPDGALGFTDHDRSLSFDGTDFEPESGFAASEVRAGSDLSVDAQDAQGVLTSDRITETDILDGRWDNAAVEVWRVNWADPGQRLLMRRGAIGQIRRGRLAFVAEVRSLAHVLGQTVGRTFQASCDAALGDARCGVDLDAPAFMGTGAVIDPLRDRAFTASGLAGFAASWFAFGTLDWTSGANAGRRAEVLAHDLVDGVAVLTLLEAPVRAIGGSDTFTIRAGCDKRIATCATRFANVANFRGFPSIPGQDAVLRYATRDGGHEGDVL
jgi:uncharacterized phage protein (TIGR02218 family)